jgi:hypothetical protein
MPVYIKIKKRTLLIIGLVFLVFLLGAVFGIFLSPPPSSLKPSQKIKLSPTPKPITMPSWLIGTWWLYLDCPSPILIFYPDGSVKLQQCDETGYMEMDKMSTYTFDGQKTVMVKSTESGGKDMVLGRIQKEGRNYLEIKGDGRSFHKASD